MVKYNLNVSDGNDVRIITVNDSTKLGKFVEKCIDIYDLSIENISGIYFYFVDAYVYIGDCEENSLDRTFTQFFEEYGDDIDNYTIDTSINPRRLNNEVDKFRNDYSNFKSSPSSSGISTYNYRPSFNITNNYYSGNSAQRQNIRRRYNPIQFSDEETTTQTNNNRANHNNANQSNNSHHSNSTPQSNTNFGNTQQRTYLYNFDIPLGTTSNYLRNYNELLNSISSLVDRSADDTNVLTRDEVNSLRSGEYESLREHILEDCTQCHITLEDFTPQTHVRVLPCRHAFKESAISQWLLNNSNKCPVCRAEVAPGIRRLNNLANFFGAFT